MKEDFKNGTATFVIPHWRCDNEATRIYFDKAINSVKRQTDPNWHIVVIDDCSPCIEAREYAQKLGAENPDQVTVICLEKNMGPGGARNEGIRYAYEHESPFILFLDADDVCDERRLEVVRKHFIENPIVNVVYSTFRVIDEDDQFVKDEDIAPSIYETLEGHKHNVVEGENAWISIATEKNYTNLTSSTAVKTTIAYTTPFPEMVKCSEDAHTWMRYGARRGVFIYDETIPSLYRIPRNTESNSRAIIGNDFCAMKVEVDEDGFMEAMKIAISNGNIDRSEKNELSVLFYIKLAESMIYANRKDIALLQVEKAKKISKELTEKVLKQKKLAIPAI
ncbi:glycosyltransferase family 2 protein [Anaeromicropila populeti]|uniref:Glycosyltransferase involved in cell wall bisynthesis n=1 Tax=Anaeromicropila populeti TaxID=37658 RepID=A0A1I6L6J5_9FIRM|nr:glycosyltransferase family 2 protein [Anaeromicropila populeti]SFR99042.1 Glycosyltransferase involved in cell wall bisynthesis [Anaeromicropila populeti]